MGRLAIGNNQVLKVNMDWKELTPVEPTKQSCYLCNLDGILGLDIFLFHSLYPYLSLLFDDFILE